MPATLMRLNAQKKSFVKPGLKICIVPALVVESVHFMDVLKGASLGTKSAALPALLNMEIL